MAVSQTINVDRGEAPAGPGEDPLLECLAVITRLHGRPLSTEALSAGLPLDEQGFTPGLFIRAAERQEYSARVLKRSLGRISNLVLPAVLLLKEGGACVLTALDRRGNATVVFPESGIGEKTLPLKQLKPRYSGYCIFVQPRPRPDERAGEVEHEPGRHWFWGTLWRFRRYYLEAMIAAALVNVLALATALFIMNVYDRVVPNNALETLFVLATGVVIAVAFEFTGRTLRGYFLDVSGKKADVLLAGRLFQQALGLRMEARPASAGAFAAQLREFESLRDFFASATLTTLTDVPFVLFFVWVIFLVGGPLYVVPLFAIPLVVTVGLLAQIPLSYLMNRHLRENSLKHGVLVESVEGMETLKTLCAEGRMQGRWENYTALTGQTAVRSRVISNMVVNFANLVTQSVSVILVVWGVHLIGRGELTLGALIACVILSSRGLAPLGQVAGLLARYQHARHAYFTLDRLMRLPVERPPGRSFLHRPRLEGDVELNEVSFHYPGHEVPVLRELTLHIRPGEHVAILGRIGSGKSTLLRLLLGLYRPASGAILLDGLDLQQFDPADLRRNIGYVSQEVRLFHGSLRENITMGAPLADDEAVLDAARLAGLEKLVAQHPLGFDLQIAEGGSGLSGGQRQAVGVARALLHAPPVLLLDEPTSCMDHTTEQTLITNLRSFMRGRTVIVVTHKPTMLQLVERVVVLDGGRLITDGPRDEVLKALTRPLQQAPRPPAQEPR